MFQNKTHLAICLCTPLTLVHCLLLAERDDVMKASRSIFPKSLLQGGKSMKISAVELPALLGVCADEKKVSTY